MSKLWMWKKRMIMVLIIMMLSVAFERQGSAQCISSRKVECFDNQADMICYVAKKMRKHRKTFYLYYPGIVKDFKRFRKESFDYAEFFELLSMKDSYIEGIIAGNCITVLEGDEECIILQLSYLTTKSQENYINHRAKRIANRFQKGTKEHQVRQVHDYIINKVEYDEAYYNPYYAFSKGRGMCMSYALMFSRIMRELRIPCIYVRGKNHAWNMVKLGGYWYNVDVTWDDATHNCRYLLKSDGDFPNHKRRAKSIYNTLKLAKHSKS